MLFKSKYFHLPSACSYVFLGLTFTSSSSSTDDLGNSIDGAVSKVLPAVNQTLVKADMKVKVSFQSILDAFVTSIKQLLGGKTGISKYIWFISSDILGVRKKDENKPCIETFRDHIFFSNFLGKKKVTEEDIIIKTSETLVYSCLIFYDLLEVGLSY